MAMPVEHVEREKLYTDTVYRFTYVAKFVDFGADDVAAIKATAPIVAPLVPAIVDAVYEKLFSFDITKQVFMPRNDGFKGNTATSFEDLTLTHDQIKFRKDFLSRYLLKLVSADYTNTSFISYLDWVGRIHTDSPKKKSRINVEYIHINALFGWLNGFLIEALEDKVEETERARTLSAYSKLLWIQNDLFARYYVKDGAEFAEVGRVGYGHSGLQKWLENHVVHVAVAQFVVIATFGLIWLSRSGLNGLGV
ncbi:hypothetical protein BDN72DRAFT_902847 [Pluteus cervinus]|uniref:Uncharacterized protein n=1 Tax=Pluteus cervinus TaxID=181527 RepID=A0ACD3AB70_9AGAR|nr:hypothetical protein BDN72DRAFT_902847 [Pluteus cervinus]